MKFLLVLFGALSLAPLARAQDGPYSISGSLIGANPVFHPTALMEYFIDGEQAFGLLHTEGNGFDYIQMKNTFLQYRLFMSPKGFLELGLGMIEKTRRDKRVVSVGAVSISGDWLVRDRSFAFRFAFGHQKTFKNGIFIAAEWLELGIPLARRGTPQVNAYHDGDVIDPAATERERDFAERQYPPYEISVARFVLGYRF